MIKLEPMAARLKNQTCSRYADERSFGRIHRRFQGK